MGLCIYDGCKSSLKLRRYRTLGWEEKAERPSIQATLEPNMKGTLQWYQSVFPTIPWETMQTYHRRGSRNSSLGNNLMGDPLRDELRAFMENSDKQTQALMEHNEKTNRALIEQNEKTSQALLHALQNLSKNNTRETASNHSENNIPTLSQT